MTMTMSKDGSGLAEVDLEDGEGGVDLDPEIGLGQEGVELVVQLVSLAQELVQAKLMLEAVSR